MIVLVVIVLCVAAVLATALLREQGRVREFEVTVGALNEALAMAAAENDIVLDKYLRTAAALAGRDRSAVELNQSRDRALLALAAWDLEVEAIAARFEVQS